MMRYYIIIYMPETFGLKQSKTHILLSLIFELFISSSLLCSYLGVPMGITI